ncbi:MAG: F0F1 ATP synthase subunit alpha, partial [Atopobium minutum]|nr:F0F1 ATP synthase subunit alpha [Atopobium minutum]
QIYLVPSLFFQGQRPAVDVGISVSRVGGSAQLKSMKQVAGTLRLDLAAFREKQAFAQFGSDLDATTQYQLSHGTRMMELLKQGRYAALDVADQIIVLFAGKEGFLDDLEVSQVVPFRDALAVYMEERHPEVRNKIRSERISDALADQMKRQITEFKEAFLNGNFDRLSSFKSEAASSSPAQDVDQDVEKD